MLQSYVNVLFNDLQSVGGNICNASPISDLNPTFMAAGTKLNLASKGLSIIFVSTCIHHTSSEDSQRTIVMDSDFFQGYKRTCLQPSELLVSILIPFTQEVCYLQAHPLSQSSHTDLPSPFRMSSSTVTSSLVVGRMTLL